MKFAEQGGFRDGIAAGLGDSLSEDGAAPQRFHAFGRFPRSVERGHVFVELGLVQCAVRVIEVLEDLDDRDVGVSVERVFEGADVRRIDGSEDLLLQNVGSARVGDVFFEIAIVGAGDTGDLDIGRVVRNGRFGSGVDWRIPIVGVTSSGEISDAVVFGDSEDEHSMTELAVTADGVDRDGIGHELAAELLEGEVRRSAFDARKLRVREVGGDGGSVSHRGHVFGDEKVKRGGGWVVQPLDSIISIVC